MQPLVEEGDRFRGVLLRADIDVDHRMLPILLEQLFIDQVDVGDFGRLGDQIGIILDVNAVGDHHLSDGRRPIHPTGGDVDFYFGPIHRDASSILRRPQPPVLVLQIGSPLGDPLRFDLPQPGLDASHTGVVPSLDPFVVAEKPPPTL